jgi:hypothetical protein
MTKTNFCRYDNLIIVFILGIIFTNFQILLTFGIGSNSSFKTTNTSISIPALCKEQECPGQTSNFALDKNNTLPIKENENNISGNSMSAFKSFKICKPFYLPNPITGECRPNLLPPPPP